METPLFVVRSCKHIVSLFGFGTICKLMGFFGPELVLHGERSRKWLLVSILQMSFVAFKLQPRHCQSDQQPMRPNVQLCCWRRSGQSGRNGLGGQRKALRHHQGITEAQQKHLFWDHHSDEPTVPLGLWISLVGVRSLGEGFDPLPNWTSQKVGQTDPAKVRAPNVALQLQCCSTDC